MAGQIISRHNRISVVGDFTIYEMSRLIAAMHNTVYGKGYQDIVLDYSKCSKAFAGPMMATVAHAQRYLREGIDVDLELPEKGVVRNLGVPASTRDKVHIRRRTAQSGIPNT
jgi:hypothetical protein